MVVEEERTDAAATRHFTLERDVVFRAEGDGVVAEVTLVTVRSDTSGAFADRFTRAASALKGQPVRLRLARDGSLTGIADEATLWARITDAVAAMVPAGRFDAAAPLRALPAEARRETLGDMLLPAIAGEDGRATPGTTRITLPARPVAGVAASLTGERTVARMPDGRWRITEHAGSAPGAVPAITLDRHLVIDPVSGLVRERVEEQVTTLRTRSQRVRSTMRLEDRV